MKDYYKILEVKKDATPDQIKKAHRKMALRWHPDRNQDNQEAAKAKFQEIQEAYDVIGNPEKRLAYDKTASDDAFSAFTRKRSDPSSFRGGARGFSSAMYGSAEFSFDGTRFTSDDFLNSIFGNNFRHTSDKKTAEPTGLDIHASISIPFNDLLSDKSATVKVKKTIICKVCSGMGFSRCKKCGGGGYDIHKEEKCEDCGGLGSVKCGACGSTGTITGVSEFMVNINVRKGSYKINYDELTREHYIVLRFAKMGNQKRNTMLNSRSYLSHGDILMHAKIEMPDFLHIYSNSDVVHDIYVKLDDLLKKDHFILKTVDDVSFKVKLNHFENLNSIRAFIPQRGILANDGKLSSYIFRINVKTPDLKKLDEEEIAALIKLLSKTY